ncbi:RagB/SusD family nutrient uptake outer membrane protein [Labilibaculum manganireducens]|uniref:RagB/SusD family nutrient uptake outer membrane protein n=1 Tax=Labilibaculum manganireducens TaxID=1940525 RepID=UPI0029F48FC6|nr:RagB/SusD family nutrient uptake outer membrane protein [Labilibaculum manganireducens]
MKKISILIVIGCLIILAVSCRNDFLDLAPQDQLTEASYFKNPDQFKASTASFYDKMISWKNVDGVNVFGFMDFGSDLSSNVKDRGYAGQGSYGLGSLTLPDNDQFWDNSYKYIRSVNLLLEKARAYEGDKDDIKQYVAESKFFRAWHHFFLLQRFGGVPIDTVVIDLDSPELYGARNSRYEVVDQVLADLNAAIPNLPTEQTIPDADKGRVSKWAAEAFKARVELYEAAWRKYTGTTTDFTGSAGPAKDQVTEFLTDAVAMAKDVMDHGGYELWDYNTGLNNRSNFYLFTIDGTGSNPMGLDKPSNKEFILQSVYDYELRQSAVQITRESWRLTPSRKLMDMYLCTDGLPADKSPLFQGYSDVSKEFENRDYRMISNVLGDESIPAAGAVSLTDGVLYGFGNFKFTSWNFTENSYRPDNTESSNYPQIRLAEVFMIYAEALYELNGSISDADLDISINLIRKRAGVAALTNNLVSANGLDMLTEIRRERALEMYSENNRFNDLKRWGIAETELNQNVCGMVVGDASYPTDFKDAAGVATDKYTPNKYGYGETVVKTADGDLNCLVIMPAASHDFQRKHYLFPLPTQQLLLNPNLVQNTGY